MLINLSLAHVNILRPKMDAVASTLLKPHSRTQCRGMLQCTLWTNPIGSSGRVFEPRVFSLVLNEPYAERPDSPSHASFDMISQRCTLQETEFALRNLKTVGLP